MDQRGLDQQLSSVAGLGEPQRRALYRYVSGNRLAVSREEAARAVGIGRPLAAYHLDRLVDDGLLEVSYGRRTGRRGPGAGRPAKLYRRSSRVVELSLPARDYALLARLLARAIEADPSGAARSALRSAARDLGGQLVTDEPAHAPRDGGTLLDRLRRVLAGTGYEPDDGTAGTIRLRNCPFDRLAAEHRDVVCEANQAMLEGLVDRLGGTGSVRAVLDPQPGSCCVALTRAGG
jgi:predicted ArsR family transcriptional regulator